jgi:hypothetical protein
MERNEFHAHATAYVAALHRLVDAYEAAIAGTTELADRLDERGFHGRANLARHAAREHQVKLIFHRAQAGAAQETLNRQWLD